MALMETHYFSNVLGMQTKMNVILPGHPGVIPHAPYRVLYLLHGMSQDYRAWLDYSLIRFYAEEHSLAVIMPDADMSWYTDMKYGFRYFTHLTKELPEIVRRMFPRISDRREDTFVAGLSMGGYGALKFGLLCPERYSHVGAFSPPPDIAWHMNNPAFPDWERRLYHDIFGTEEEYLQSENNLYAQAAIRRHAVGDTKFFVYCGSSDVYVSQSRSIAIAMQDAKYDIRYEESNGDHNWDFWNRVLPAFIGELPQGGNGGI